MSFLLRIVKSLLIGSDIQVQTFEEDFCRYSKVVDSSKYADSNSKTLAIEELISAAEKFTISGPQTANIETEDNNEEIKVMEKWLDDEKCDRKSRLTTHLNLLEELEDESCLVLPGVPLHKGSRFNRRVALGIFKVPKYIYNALQVGHDNNLTERLTCDNYVKRFQDLLWIEEAHQAIEMHRYDMENVMLGTCKGPFFRMEVPGLAEGRPSLMKGDRVYLKSSKRQTIYEGYIHDVQETEIFIKLHQSLHSTAMDGLKFDATFMTSRIGFRRCHQIVTQIGHFKRITFPNEKNSSAKPMILIKETNPDELRCFNKTLNTNQRKAVMNILKSVCRPAPFIIFGPPGTGKTVTIVEAILQVYARLSNSRILVCSNSNSSTDILAISLKKSKVIPSIQLLRLSAIYRMEKLIPPEIEDITESMETLDAHSYENYRVVVTTCIQAGSLNEFSLAFDYVFVDEAGRANEPETLIPFGLLDRNGCAVLGGDPYQLGPVIMSKFAAKNGLGLSFLERLSKLPAYERSPQNSESVFDERFIVELTISYRSDPRILSVPNHLFYGGQLEFVTETPEKWLRVLNITHPVVMHHVEGLDRRERCNPSWFNPSEAIACLGYVKRLYSAGLLSDQIGIITPYRRQIHKLNLLLEGCKLKLCKIGTMEEFQGDERDVIIISTVRSRTKYLDFDKKFNLGFLCDPKRFNVAVSRARWLVIVIGDTRVLKLDPSWDQFIDEAEKILPPMKHNDEVCLSRSKNRAKSELGTTVIDSHPKEETANVQNRDNKKTWKRKRKQQSGIIPKSSLSN